MLAGAAFAAVSASHPAVNATNEGALFVALITGLLSAAPSLIGAFIANVILAKKAWPRVTKAAVMALMIALLPSVIWIGILERVRAGVFSEADWASLPRALLLIALAYLPVSLAFWFLLPSHRPERQNDV